jgi:hypothetical protein
MEELGWDCTWWMEKKWILGFFSNNMCERILTFLKEELKGSKVTSWLDNLWIEQKKVKECFT